MNINFFLIIFSFSVCVSIVSYYFNKKIFNFLKGIPIICLIIYILINNYNNFNIQSFFVLFALIFGLIGDLLLLNDKFFLIGLYSFLIGHIFYILRFKQNSIYLPNFYIIVLILSFQIFIIFLYLKMKNQDKKIYFPSIVLYSIFISLMFFYVLNYDFYKYNKISLCSAGAFLFYISDSILSIDKFIFKFKTSMIFILLFYYFGQFLLSFSIF